MEVNIKSQSFCEVPKEKLKKAKLRERVIHFIEKKGIEIEKAFQKFGLKISPYSYPRIYRNYKDNGLEGLIDTRGGKRIEKITAPIKKYILYKKKEDEKLTASGIREIVLERFNIGVHENSISNILKEAGLSNKRGRPESEVKEVSEKAIDHAGGFLIKGVLIKMGLIKIITERIKKGIKQIKEKEFDNYSWMSIFSASKEIIAQKVESLLYMPIFQMERIWHFKTVYPRDGLGLLCGKNLPYKYHTMDNFLREIPLLNIDKQLSRDLAMAYIEVFQLQFETKEEQTFYIDCHKKVLWTKQNVPKGMHATRNKILKCLNVYFIHDCTGRPILPWSRPGDSHLVNELFPIVEELEKAVGKEIVKFMIFDREGVSVALFIELTEKGKRFITILKENQYNSEEDFDFEKGSKWETVKIETVKGKKRYKIKEGMKVLTDPDGKEYEVRAILTRDLTTGKKPVFITNIMKTEEPDVKKIVQKYIKRQDQENSFKQMKPGLYLDTNHGNNTVALKKNRVINRKIKKMAEEISAKENMIKSAQAFIKKKVESIKNKKGKMQYKVQQLRNKFKLINKKIQKESKADKRKELLNNQQDLFSTIAGITKYYETILSKWQSEIRQKLDYVNNKKEEMKEIKNEVSKIDQNEILYEIDSRKDHIMTNLEVALNNADIYLKQNFFPGGYKNLDFRTVRDILYKQEGYIKESKDEILVSLKHYQQEPEHQMLAEYVVEKFNAAEIFIANGKKLCMRVM